MMKAEATIRHFHGVLSLCSWPVNWIIAFILKLIDTYRKKNCQAKAETFITFSLARENNNLTLKDDSVREGKDEK